LYGSLVSDDFRIFCGDLGNDVTDEILTRAFSKYQSFLKAKVVRDKRSNKTKGFGFVSFKDPQDFIKAMKEMNGEYIFYLYTNIFTININFGKCTGEALILALSIEGGTQ
jgi:RNA recognition motif-containing protein